MDIFSPQKRSEIMRKVKGKNSKAELLLRRALFKKGLRYRIHRKDIIGKPDVVFLGLKVVVFVDGDWWHGRYYERDNRKYQQFWREKIKNNMDRDERVNNALLSDGWKVLRYWQKDIEKNTEEIAGEIYATIKDVD